MARWPGAEGEQHELPQVDKPLPGGADETRRPSCRLAGRASSHEDPLHQDALRVPGWSESAGQSTSSRPRAHALQVCLIRM